MNSTARFQAWSSLVAAVALPMLYFAGTHDLPALSATGLGVFTAGMLAPPAKQFLEARSRAD